MRSDEQIFSVLPAPVEIGDWRVFINPAWDGEDLRKTLVAPRERSDAELLQQGRERVVKTRCELGDASREIVVKTYRAPGKIREFFEGANKGSKAVRAFAAAWRLREKNVGTPEPVAVAERRDAGGHLLESRLVTEFVPALTNFRDELFRIYSENPDCEALMSLMQKVADACRAMHDAGVVHRDLGNQNIGIRKLKGEGLKLKEGEAEALYEVVFIDLDRVRIFPAGTLTDAQRGRDLARLDLPSDLRRVFHSMYYMGYGPPAAFVEAEAKARAAFARHTALRPWRHPFREWRIRREERRAALAAPPGKAIPLGKELWIWDERSVQAIPAYMSRERRKFRSAGNIFRIAKEVFARGLALRRNFAEADALSFRAPAAFAGAFGMTLEATFEQDWATQLRFLGELEEAARERLPVLLRVYHHKGRAQWDFAAEKARELHARGNGVALALVQDRAAVRDPASWREMVLSTVEKTRAFADFYEVGHATNRGKWGVWDFHDYARLLAPALEAKRKYPELRLTGPACIDFDLHSLPGLLSVVPAGTFHALSQHLYVDRRGAPENFQGKFDLARKCAIHRAFAKTYGFSEEKIIVSEVNWPLLGAGTHSPCSAFYCGRGDADGARSAPHVSEEEYAKFLCRYVLLAVASGHVSRVYWWRLVHRGFGLVDDADAENPRARPAFSALKTLLAQLAGARFERRLADIPAGTFALELSRPDASRFRVSWTKDSDVVFTEEQK